MGLPRRRLLAALPALLLSGGLAGGLTGCGFRPLYGRGPAEDALRAELATVAVARIPERSGQLLRNALERRLERAGGGRPKLYTLSVALEERIEELGVERDNTAARANLYMTARFVLARDGRRLLSGTSQSIAAYNILAQPYATVISQKDSRERAAEQLAEDIVRRLAVFFANPEEER